MTVTGPRFHRRRTVITIADYTIAPCGCWLWNKAVNSSGNAVVSMGGKRYCAHVVMYEQMIGLVPKGKELDHVDCVARHCINPYHLEPVTHQENIRRAKWKERLKKLSRQS